MKFFRATGLKSNKSDLRDEAQIRELKILRSTGKALNKSELPAKLQISSGKTDTIGLKKIAKISPKLIKNKLIFAKINLF